MQEDCGETDVRAPAIQAEPTQPKLSWAQQGEDLVLDRIIRRKLRLPKDYQGFYVDVGAHHPTIHSNTKLLYDAGWTGVNLDIQQMSVDLLIAERPRDVSLTCAVGSSMGSVRAFLHKGRISGTNTCNADVAKRHMANGFKMNSVEIPLRTLDSILDEHKPANKRLDFLNIDVEGFELEVLKGLSLDRYPPRVIAMEIHAAHVMEALHSETAQYLRSKGYECVGSTVITYFFMPCKSHNHAGSAS